MFSFLRFGILDFIDIFLVALLMYQVYKMIRGTVAINIFIGIFGVYLFWLLVKALNMQLLSSILGQFIGVGVIALIIVFQQEIRRFLIVVTSKYLTKSWFSFDKLFQLNTTPANEIEIDAILSSIQNMSKTKTGALIVISKYIDLLNYTQTGERINANINAQLIESIFFKNNPLHDGAIIIVGNKIKAAKCILPSTVRQDIPAHYGLRHRAALGISEETNTITLVVSEERGTISYAVEGQAYPTADTQTLKAILLKYLQ
ncbi:MAG: TIGR00159 family protein [Bacteroidales bacterium]|nr:TIGR00159 family protein [Bacteroidales bacterium]